MPDTRETNGDLGDINSPSNIDLLNTTFRSFVYSGGTYDEILNQVFQGLAKDYYSDEEGSRENVIKVRDALVDFLTLDDVNAKGVVMQIVSFSEGISVDFLPEGVDKDSLGTPADVHMQIAKRIARDVLRNLKIITSEI